MPVHSSCFTQDKVRMLEPCMAVIESGLHRYEVARMLVCVYVRACPRVLTSAGVYLLLRGTMRGLLKTLWHRFGSAST